MTDPEVLASLAKRIPLYARRVLHAGCGQGELGQVLKTAGFEVYGIEDNPSLVETARTVLKTVGQGSLHTDTVPFEGEVFDCIVWTDLPEDGGLLKRALSTARKMLDANGALVLLVGKPSKHPATIEEGVGTGRPDTDPELVRQTLKEIGLEIYLESPLVNPEQHELEQAPFRTPIDLHKLPFRIWKGARAAELASCCILTAVHATYDPLAHARALFLSGKPELSYEVLGLIPGVYLEDPTVRALVAAERAACLVAWDQAARDGQTLQRFQVVQALFFEATSLVPLLHQAYHCYAELWHLLGDDSMAVRILRSILHAAPNPATESQLKVYRTKPLTKPRGPEPPPWTPSTTLPRVLLITDDQPNYGLDVLYDGLCSVLGKENVVEYPWKPTLHGRSAERFGYYPCLFNYPGGPLGYQELLVALREGRFDLILFGDFERKIPPDHAREIGRASARIALFLVDLLDNAQDNRAGILQFLGRNSAAGYFKREQLACLDYGPQTYPLPFAYSESYMPSSIESERSNPVFWAGNRRYGLRRLYLEYLEPVLGLDFSAVYLPDEYRHMLCMTRIGLDIPGVGFDTARYWEIPAHGAMLLAERRPTVIPFNFSHNESAVFFEDLPDLERHLRFYLEHPDESAAIARAGHEHFKRHHTAIARARHVLGWIYKTLGW